MMISSTFYICYSSYYCFFILSKSSNHIFPRLIIKVSNLPTKHKTFIQRRPNVFDVGPTFHKCHTNVLCLLGCLLDVLEESHRVTMIKLIPSYKNRMSRS